MKRIKKCGLIILSILFIFNICNIDTKVHSEAAPGIAYDAYYRIKNLASGFYLTVNSTSDSENLRCSLKERSMSSAQQFKIQYNFNTSNYKIIPNSSSTGKVLSLNGADANGTLIVLKTYTNSSTQRWNIDKGPTSMGYRLRPESGTKALATNNKNTALNSSVVLWDYTGFYTDWILEPVYSGTAGYYAITPLGTNDSSCANDIVQRLVSMGYTASRVNLPVNGQLYMGMPTHTVSIIHGHGGAGFIRLDASDGSSKYFYSENPPSGSGSLNYFTPNGLRRNQYIIYIACNSADNSTSRKSVALASYLNAGASCVTGFANTVSGGEYYVRDLLFYLNFYQGSTIATAINYADSQYSKENREKPDCPANPSNRTTYGRMTKTIKMN